MNNGVLTSQENAGAGGKDKTVPRTKGGKKGPKEDKDNKKQLNKTAFSVKTSGNNTLQSDLKLDSWVQVETIESLNDGTGGDGSGMVMKTTSSVYYA